MVNALLKEELAREGGIHALQLKTRTPEEEEKAKAKEAAQWRDQGQVWAMGMDRQESENAEKME